MTKQIAPKVTIDGNEKITSWEDDDGFTMFVEPRMATAEDINDALTKMASEHPDVVVGTFQGVRFHG